MKLSSISESGEYAGLEDADEFEDEFIHCSHCDTGYSIPDPPLTPCENCGAQWCYDCLPGGKIWKRSIWKRSSKTHDWSFQTDPPINLPKDVHDLDAQDFYEIDWHFDLLLTCPFCPKDKNGFIQAIDNAPNTQLESSEYAGLEDADEFQVDDDMAECDVCGTEFGSDIGLWGESGERLYQEIDRLSSILAPHGYHPWWFCSPQCMEHKFNELKKEIAQKTP